MKIRISLTKNSDSFLLLSEDDGFRVVIEDCYLNVTYIRLHEAFLDQIRDRMQREPAPYFIERPEIIIKPIKESLMVIKMPIL